MLGAARRPVEAALGAIIRLDLPGGAINQRIPPGAQSGKRLRVRGRAFPPIRRHLYIGRAHRHAARRPAKAKELYEAMAKEPRSMRARSPPLSDFCETVFDLEQCARCARWTLRWWCPVQED